MSTALHFVSRQTDRLLLGRLLGVAVLGVYTIGLMLAEAMATVVTRVTHGVLFPAFSRVSRDESARLQEVYYRVRLRLDLTALPVMGALTILGSRVVELLYDPRYAEAGWILEALCVRVAMDCVLTPCETCLFAMGHTRYGFYRSAARAVWIVVGIPVGWQVAGLGGLVWAAALSAVPVLVVLWMGSLRHGILVFRRELVAVAGFGGGAILGLMVDSLLS